MVNDKPSSVAFQRQNTSGASRREFLSRAAAAAFSIVPRHVLGGEGHVPPSEKTTLAGIGVGGQGMQNMTNLMQLPEVQAVAVCDVNRKSGGYLSMNWAPGERRTAGREPARRAVDEFYAKGKRSGTYRGCNAYSDFRELLAKEKVDAVMIATPDHAHAVVTMAAIKAGKHVYCEKPLAYTVYEARQMAEAAKKAKVATQLGNQGQASEEARLTREFILDEALGPVREVQAWSGPRPWPWPAWEGRPAETPPIPEGLDWDLWLGPAPMRPYHPAYCPWTWRNWWDFGTGMLGDLGCHMLSAVFKAFMLKHPISIEASSTRTDMEIYPLGVIARFEFSARGDMPPLTLTWYDGGLKPAHPKGLEPGRGVGGVTCIGDSGTLMDHRLVPESRMKAYGRPPKKLARSPGHYKEWVDACRGGPPAGSNFVDHGGLLTEMLLLGNVALRAGNKIDWDGPNLRVTNDAGANRYLHREYRQGWTL
jgi:predicted dehydrogenase